MRRAHRHRAGTAESLANHQPPVLKVTIGQRVAFAGSACTGRLVADLDANSPAAREIAALAAEIARIGR
jgi:chromosome partitioning protein